MRARSLLLWIAVGLVGLVLAAGVSFAATQLSSQRIGLSAEPPSAGEELAPVRHAHTTAPPATAPARTTPGAAAQPGDDGHPPEEHREGGSDWDD